MSRFYRSADAFLLTSQREGWSLALGEALDFGLPCVLYELPYLVLTQNNEGVVSVPQDHSAEAAEALAHILLDKQLAHRMGTHGREFMRKLRTYDYAAFWSGCFASALHPLQDNTNEDSTVEAMLWHELFGAYRSHLESIEREFCALKNERGLLIRQSEQQERDLKNLQNEIQTVNDSLSSVLASKSFKVGSIILKLPRAIRRTVSHLRRD
jgi:hypothetical protein